MIPALPGKMNKGENYENLLVVAAALLCRKRLSGS